MVTREDRYEIFKALHDEGATDTEIAALLEFSRGYVNAVLNDRDGTKIRARKRSYGGVCVDCGAATTGSNGHALAPKRCAECHSNAARAKKVWTREAIVEAVRFFAAKYGRPPSAADWNPAMARATGRKHLADRYYADSCWPSVGSVYASGSAPFKKWSDAIRAAGFTPNPVGRPRKAA